MAKSYVKYLSDNAPANSKQGGTVSVTAGSFKVIALEVPHEGRITQVMAKQVGGTGVAYTIDILNSAGPYPVGEYTNGTVQSTSAPNIGLHKVVPQISAISGAVATYRADQGQAYRNADGDTTAPVRKLYMLIQPTGAGTDTTWDLMFHVWVEIGN